MSTSAPKATWQEVHLGTYWLISALEGVFCAVGLVCLGLSIAFMVKSEPTYNGLSTTHPNVEPGLALVVLTVVGTLVALIVVRLLKAFVRRRSQLLTP